MARTPNPFRPGFNQPPAALTGRSRVIEAITEAIDVAALDRRTPRPVILTGGRGVGKTVLLGEAAAIAAARHSWLTVPVEIRPNQPFMPQLLKRLTSARDIYRQTPPDKRVEIAAAKIRATVLGIGAEVEIQRASAATRDNSFEVLLTETCQAADQHDAGVLLVIDELQFAHRTELAELAATLQQHVPDNWALTVVLAGLPSIRDTQKGVTYLERGEWHVLGLLDEDSTSAALATPAKVSGRPMDADACALLAQASGGYPYAIQVVGHHAWRTSTNSDAISLAHAQTAVHHAHEDLAAGLYESRWQDASPKEREYLIIVAQLASKNDVVTSTDVAAALGKATSEISYLRSRLTLKGTIFAEGSALRFPVPGMAAWIMETKTEQ